MSMSIDDANYWFGYHSTTLDDITMQYLKYLYCRTDLSIEDKQLFISIITVLQNYEKNFNN